jgi:DNA-binding transcriptional LysR family regulator
MDDLRSLRHFVEIARQGSFTAAAGKLALTVPGLSRSIAGLEKRLGMRLFVRTTRNLHLTAEGQALFDRIAPAFSSIEASISQSGSTSQAPTGLVRMSTVTAFGKHCVVPLLPEFFARHPGIELAMSFHDGARGLTRQSHDVRINWGERQEQGKVAQLLCTMPLILVASPDYLARRGTPQKPEDLADHECIATALANGTRAHWVFIKRSQRKRRGAAKQIEFIPRGRLVVMDELDAVGNAAIAGLGITMSAAENVLGELHDGSLVRVLPAYETYSHDASHAEIIIQYPSPREISPKVRVLVDFLLERLRGRNPLEIVAQARKLPLSAGTLADR